jgi:hypothetical protein
LAIKGHAFCPQLSYALIFADGDPILYELGDMVDHQRMYCTWIKPDNIRFSYCWLDGTCGPAGVKQEAEKFAKAIAADLEASGVRGERVGVDALDEPGRAALRAEGVELVDVKPAEFASGGVRSKWNTYDVYHHGNTDRIVDPGDLVVVNTCGTTFAGYRVCIYRSFILGRKPNRKERDFYKLCYDRVYGIIEAIKPGATTADAAKALRPSNTWGYPAEQSLLVAEVGHGIGMTYEEPVVSRIWSFQHPQILEPGMVIAVECREGEWGYGGVRLEEMVLVTETGHRVLSNWPAEEIIPVSSIL